jgi:uncharacterized protein (UPF0216 family)
MQSTQRLYAIDVAKLYGKTERTARRMLEELEEKHGPAVVRRDGRERYTTREALEDAGALASKASYDPAKLLAALRRLLSDVAAMATRVDQLDDRITDLSVRLAHVHV